jgi:hypothetical protein
VDDKSKSGRWLEPRNCVWTGPGWLTIPQLSSIEVYAPLKEFFVKTLFVRNAELNDILDHLRILAERNEDLSKVHLVYEQLAILAKKSSHDKEKIRYGEPHSSNLDYDL